MLESRADDRSDLRIGFYHRMEANRGTAVQDRELIFNFRCMGSNPTTFTDIYKSRFDASKSEIQKLLTETNGQLTGQKLTLITSRYDIDEQAHNGFFDAYTEALNAAFVDFVVDNPDLVALFGDVFEASIEEYR